MFLACERQTFLLAHRRRPSAVMNEKNVFRSQASMFPQPEKLQNHSNEGKGKEKKKERGEVKGGEEKKAMVALLVFIIATLEIVFGRKNCSTQKVNLSITLSKIRLDAGPPARYMYVLTGNFFLGSFHLGPRNASLEISSSVLNRYKCSRAAYEISRDSIISSTKSAFDRNSCAGIFSFS